MINLRDNVGVGAHLTPGDAARHCGGACVQISCCDATAARAHA
jgi:hypothetical protein